MPKVSINILTKDRAELLKKSLLGIKEQSFRDFEVRVVDDGSRDETMTVLDLFAKANSAVYIINHPQSQGITLSRQEALAQSAGEYIAILDDDDQWVDKDKLKKQVGYLDSHPEVVLVGGGISVGEQHKNRPQSNEQIRASMLFKNNFFTSTVMFRKQAALRAGGFIKDADDFAEDYDLWLRLGKQGKIYNFQEVFTQYAQPSYSKEKFLRFLSKQLRLAQKHRADYPNYLFSVFILKLRLYFGV